MTKKKFVAPLLAGLALLGVETHAQTLDYSFVVVGCNRVDYLDTAATTGTPNSTGASTANVYQLRRMFSEVANLNPKPKYLFLAGDVVMGYTNDTAALTRQLRAWKQLYYNSPIATSGIKVVVVPGNHETQDKAAGKLTYSAAERTFVREMDSFIMNNNGPLPGGPDHLTTDQSKLTYSFNFGCDHFIMIDTDPYGYDGRVPFKWIASDIQNARANNARHIFAVGHKPAWSSPYKPLDGLEAFIPERDSFWKYMENNQALAMFSAHEHVWDKIHPHADKTWQIIAGNGGSLVETTWMASDQRYFGFTLVNVYKNNQVNVKSYGRTADMAKYSQPQDSFPTTVRADFNIGIAPVFSHTPMTNQSGHGPFAITATITDDIQVTGAQLNYSVNGVAQAPISPVVNGSNYTFTIPATTPTNGIIRYNISAHDASGVNYYTVGCASDFHQFTFCSPYTTNINVTPAYPVAGQALNTIYLGYGTQSETLTSSVPAGYPPFTFSWSPMSASTNSISVSPTSTTNYSVNVTDAYGCPSSSSKTIFVKDVRDPNHSNKIFVCHKGNSLSVSINAIPAHLDHGDDLGNCNSTARTITEEQKFTVYPNPVNNQVTINCTLVNSERVRINITDLQGKQVLETIDQSITAGTHDVQVNTSNLANGVYLVKVICGKDESSIRMVVQH
jgi:hypothetical protein